MERQWRKRTGLPEILLVSQGRALVRWNHEDMKRHGLKFLVGGVGLAFVGAATAAVGAGGQTQAHCGTTAGPRTGVEHMQLWVMNADGSDPQPLIASERPGVPNWSPDSSLIASVNYPGVLVVTAADGSGSRAITDPSAIGRAAKGDQGSAAVGQARWSPDGRFLRFTTVPEDPTERTRISLLRPDGTDLAELGEIDEATAEALRRGAWSPDGTQVAFDETNPESGADLYTMNADGSGRKLVAHGPGRVFYPSWSPDGRKIAFASDSQAHALTATRIEVVDADGTGRHIVSEVRNNRDLSNTSWSPDGRWITAVNVDHEHGSTVLTLVRPDGSDRHNFPQAPSYLQGYPSWAPGGGQIAFVDGNGIRVASPGASRGVCLTTDGYNEAPMWSPDGKKIAFLREAAPSSD